MRTLPACALISLLFTSIAFAGDDPSIRGDLRTQIQDSMRTFVDAQTTDGVVRLYDPVDGRLLSLKLAEVHSGIVKKGDFYVSCADFTDQRGRAVDVDFLVLPDDRGTLRATQAIVHSVDGKKRAYHLENE